MIIKNITFCNVKYEFFYYHILLFYIFAPWKRRSSVRTWVNINVLKSLSGRSFLSYPAPQSFRARSLSFRTPSLFKRMRTTNDKITQEWSTPSSVIPRLTGDLRLTKGGFSDRGWRFVARYDRRGCMGSGERLYSYWLICLVVVWWFPIEWHCDKCRFPRMR